MVASGECSGADCHLLVERTFNPASFRVGMALESDNMSKPIAKWLGLLGLWAFVGLVLTVEVYFNLRVSRPDISFFEVAQTQYARAILWALLAPLVLWLRLKVPLSSGRFVAGAGFHLVVSLLIMVSYYLGRTVVVVVVDRGTLDEFWCIARSSFFGRNLIDAAYYWAVLAAGYSFDLYRRFKNEEIKAAQLESRLIETELKALKQQLQPHFLFNTMNTIAVLVREGRNDDAVTLIARLGSLLRMSLDLSRVQEVTLRQEMEFIDRYVEIQKVRFADRLTVRTRIDPEALEARIPNLLLQPLVENAIIHGIAPQTKPGTVELIGRVLNGRLQVEVRDDGCGFTPDDPERPRKRRGIGLANTHERMAKRYGADGEFAVRSEPGQGTSIWIAFPFRR